MPATSMNLGIYNSSLNRLEFPGTMEKGEMLSFHYANLDETHKLPIVCFTKEQEILINDLQKEARTYTGQDPVSLSDDGEIVDALIYIPLYSKGKLLGVISVQSFEKNSYEEYHLLLLKHIASYVGVAIENAMFYQQMEEEVQRRTKEVIQQKNELENNHQSFTIISEIGKDIISSLSVEEILEKAYDNVNTLMDATAFGIGIYNKSLNRLDFPGAIEKGVKLPFSSDDLTRDSFASKSFLKGEEVVINSISELLNIDPQVSKARAGESTESLIYLPLKKGDETIGVITVQSFKKDAYSTYHIDMLKTLANYTAIAIVNARSYESISTLSEIGKEISSSLDLNSMLQTLHKKVNLLMDAPIFMVSSYSEKDDLLTYELCIENNERILEGYNHKLGDADNSFSAWTIHNKNEIIIGNNEEEHSLYIKKTVTLGGSEPNSLIFIPLIVEGKSIGILSVQSLKFNAYTKYHVEMLRSLASYVSIALNNAIAYKELDETKNEMKRLSLVASETDNAVIIMDKDGKFEWVNRAYHDLTGFDLNSLIETIGTSIRDIDDQDLQKQLDKVFATRKSVSFESNFLSKTGQKIWVQTNLTPVLNEQNEIVKLVAIDSNITEIKNAQIALNKSQKDHKALFEQIIDSVFIFDSATYKILDCNKAVLETYGYTKAEIRSMTPMDLHPQWEREMVLSKIDINTKKANEYYHVTKSGKQMVVEVRSENVEYKGVKATMSIVRDITDRKQFEDKIIKQNIELEKLSIVASNTDNSVIICSPNGEMTWANEGFKRTYGLDLIDFKRKFGNTLLAVSHDKQIEKYIEQAISSKRGVDFETLFDKGDGNQIWVRSNVTAVFDDYNQLKNLVLIGSDITEVKQSELKIREKNKDITDSINYASRIQRAMLPKKNTIEKLLPNSFILYKPRDIVSGDFYWMIETPNKEIIVATVDCTGHGVPGAFLTIVGNNLLNQIVNYNGITYPGDILSEMNKQMLEQFAGTTMGGMKDGMDMSLCRIKQNGDKYHIDFAGAFNSLFHISENKLQELTANRFSIGTPLENNPVYDTHSFECKKGDILYMCSDGYQDQIGGDRGKKLKKVKFKELLLENHSLPISKQREFYNDVIENWKGSFPQLDDILLMGISF